MGRKFKLFNGKNEVFPYVQEIQASADKEKRALGFLARDAYKKAAHNERIIVAVNSENNDYAGHVLFGGVFPNGRVFQTLVKKKYRRTGVAQALITKLIELLEARGYTSLSAKVGTDLRKANAFYAKMGLEIVKIVDGRNKSGRKLNLRNRALVNPTLFTGRPSQANELFFPTAINNQSPLFLIDLNVVFDVVKKRARTKQAKDLFRAVSQNLIRVAISEELIKELEGTSFDKKNDPILEMVKGFWTLANPPTSEVDKYFHELAPVIFSDRHRNNQITKQDRSDLIHLAVAIKERTSGFVTSETKILNSANHLREKYGLDIISPYEISELVKDEPKAPDAPLQTSEMACFVTSDLNDEVVKKAIEHLKIPGEALPRSEGPNIQGVQQLVIFSPTREVIAYAWWSCIKAPQAKNQAYLHVSPLNTLMDTIAAFICDKIMRDTSQKNISLLSLGGNAENESVFQIFKRNGFGTSSLTPQSNALFTKICLGTVLHPDNWKKKRLEIEKISGGIKLPEFIPEVSQRNELITLSKCDGFQFQIKLSEFERLFYPTLLVSKSATGVILPIRRSYSEELLNTHEQLSLLDAKEAILCQERVYFSSPKTKKTLGAGQLVFFYESGKEKGGRKAVIAVARISQSTIMVVDSLKKELLRRGVIDPKTLKRISPSGKMTVTFFENIIPFKRSIGFKRLCEIGCNDGSNFVTAKSISGKHVLQLIKEGLPNG